MQQKGWSTGELDKKIVNGWVPLLKGSLYKVTYYKSNMYNFSLYM